MFTRCFFMAVFLLAVCSWCGASDVQPANKMQQSCAARLQALSQALNKFAESNSGKYPAANDASGWAELRRQNLIKSNSDYRCPQNGSTFNYIGGKTTDSTPNAPLAWCSCHRQGKIFSNVLLAGGQIKAMESPMTYVPASPTYHNQPQTATAPEKATAPQPARFPKKAAVPTTTTAAKKAALPPPSRTADPMPSSRQTPAHWVKGPDKNWYVHYEDALAAAKRENKKILLLHTGSDWCGWCKRLAEDVLEKEEFKSFAGRNFILLYFDSPSKRHLMSTDQRNHVKQTEYKLNVSGGYPGTFIFDNNGRFVGKIGGYRDLDSYLNELKKFTDTPAKSTNDAAFYKRAKMPEKSNGNAPAARRNDNTLNSGSTAPAHWLKGPTDAWYIHLEDAKRAAKRTGKKIYALHTGSDWCPPCMNLEKNILSSSKFKRFARENLILLFVDSPRKKPIPDDQRAYNRQLARMLNFGSGVPSILLLDANGNPINRIGGRKDAKTHIKAIRDALK